MLSNKTSASLMNDKRWEKYSNIYRNIMIIPHCLVGWRGATQTQFSLLIIPAATFIIILLRLWLGNVSGFYICIPVCFNSLSTAIHRKLSLKWQNYQFYRVESLTASNTAKWIFEYLMNSANPPNQRNLHWNGIASSAKIRQNIGWFKPFLFRTFIQSTGLLQWVRVNVVVVS